MFKKKKDQTYQSYWSISWNIFKKNKVAMVCLFIVILLCLIALFAPLIAPYDPNKQVLTDRLMKPCGQHWFGTDDLGRDIFSRIIYGTRTTLVMAFSLLAIVFFVGGTLGVIAGFYGGIVDNVIMKISDMMMAFPGLILAIAIAGILGPSTFNAVLAISLVTWPRYARLARSLTLKIRKNTYIEVAIMGGITPLNLFLKYLLPNIFPTMLVTATIDIGMLILEITSLSFLGVGVQAPIPEWGLMLNEGRLYIFKAPWLIYSPGIAIIIVVVIFNLLGDSIRDILDPKEN